MHKTNIDTLRNEAKRQLQLLKDLLQKAHNRGLVEAPAAGEKDRATFDTESLPKALEVLDGESYKLDHLDMVLAVVGTMKAGKSTSINAIVGAEVLPNRNRPMTALPTLIRHTPGVLTPRLVFEKVKPLNDLLKTLHSAIKKTNPEILKELENDTDMAQLLEKIQQREPFASRHDGEEGIFNFLKGLNDLVRLCFATEVNFPFEEYSTVDSMPVIEVEFTHLKDTPATQGRLTLLDTPGPNEAGQQHLRHMLKDQLKKASAVLAVLDYTQLKSDADAQVRENLLEISETAKDRMYALVNKFDQKDRNSDDAAAVKKYVSQTLMKGVIAQDGVFPVSANQGYLASRALNEIHRNGTLNTADSWVKDFAEEAFGKRWAKYIEDPKEVKEGANHIWEDSGFSEPLTKVIVEAHQNAALEALRSAASKLESISRDAGNFFKASVGSLKKSTAELQKNIHNLQQDIESISRTERETEAALQQALRNMQSDVKESADAIEKDIKKTLEDYLKKGKEIEKNIIARNIIASKKAKEKLKLDESSPLHLLGIAAKVITGGQKSKEKPSNQNETITNAQNGIVKFDEKTEANNFRGEIEESILAVMVKAEKSFQKSIEDGVKSFSQELVRQRSDSLDKIQKSAQKNIDGFDIEIQLPDAKSISLDTSVSGILKNAVEEKTKTVTRHRRKSGAWGTVCRWFGTDDWGWESYSDTEEYYEVDLTKINTSSQESVQNLFRVAHSALNDEIYPQLHQGVEEFFRAFREKIEHIRGDLMSGLQKHSLDQEKKASILEESTKMAREASGLEKDCAALNDSTETLRRDEGVSVARGEVLA